jgi:hypothetical protein
MKAKLSFECSCYGCRNISRRVAEIYHASQLDGKVEGYFFSPSTMKFFSSRVATWEILINPQGEGEAKRNGLAVIVSSRYGYEGAAREYEIVRICQYGDVSREDNPANEKGGAPFIKYDTLRQAKKALAAAVYPVACTCHGCQLDRAGR